MPMATIAELLVKINANSSGLRKEIASSQRQMKRAFGPEALETSSAAAGLLGVLTAAIGATGVASVSLAGKLSMTQKALETLTGSAETAKNMIGDLKKLDDKSSFSFETYAKGAQKLLALGTAADQVIPTLTTVGDASAALGQGEEGIDRIILALSQMTAKGKVSAQEMNQLAENNVQGWRYLSEAMGVSIAEVMKLAEKGSINGRAAVQTILAGLQKDYKGSMDKIANETPIVWNTIVSSAGQILAGIGPTVDKAFGINKTLIKARDYLVEFKASVDKVGIKETLEEMVPPGVSIAITVLAGAITGAAIPALKSLAINAVAALAPLLPYIAVGAAVAAAVWGITKAVDAYKTASERAVKTQKDKYDTLRQLIPQYEQLKNKSKLTTAELKEFHKIGNKIADLAPSMVTGYDDQGNAVLNLTAKQRVLNAELKETQRLEDKAYKEKIKNAQKAVDSAQKEKDAYVSAWQQDYLGMADNIKKQNEHLRQVILLNSPIPLSESEIAKQIASYRRAYESGLEQADAKIAKKQQELTKLITPDPVKPVGNTGDTSKTGNSGSPSLLQGGTDPDKLKEKAKSLHETLASAWAQTNDNDKEQLDIWYKQQQDALKEVGNAYGTYKEDMATLDAIYKAKSIKLEEDKARRIKDLKRAAQDDVTNNQNQLSGIGLEGVDKDVNDLSTNYNKAITDIERKYEDLQTKFSTATAAEKQEMIAAWQEAGYAFKEYADGTVNFNEQAAKDRYVIDQQYYNDLLALRYDYQKNEDALAQARKDGKIAAYMEELNTERAAMSEDLAGRQAMIDTYYEIWQAAHLTAMEAMAEVTASAFDGMTTFFADIINGVSSIGDAWSKLKSSVLTMIGQMVAKWIAGQIMMMITGQTVQRTTTAGSTEAAATTAAAWAPAAAVTSLASFGGNSAPALIAIAAVLAAVLAATAFASGGSVSGPGTGTSDNVWARLSDGEYVMKASTVKKFGTGFFDALNAGRMPAFATGGLVTGPSLDTIGSNRYSNAASPINSKSLDKSGLLGNQQPAGDQYQITLQTLDGKSTEYWLENGGGSKVIKFLKKEVRGFAPVEV
jgi:tape measure domain-containing protein